ncbi:MAG TPA: hypothetical protein VJT73_11765 [Polyangiaceae bacterium]|nr:hypothetical protein [Polyangiaceae bacterium]
MSGGLVFADTDGRDSNSVGRLRDNYVTIKTPLISIDLRNGIVATPRLRNPFFTCRFNPECYTLVRPDWFLRTPAEVRPASIIDQITRLQGLTSPAILFPSTQQVPASIIAVRAPDRLSIELSPTMSDAVKRLVATGDQFWLTPVEAGYQGKNFVDGAVGGLPLTAVAVPRSWSQASSSPMPIVGSSTGILLASEVPSPSHCDPTHCNGPSQGCFEDHCRNRCDESSQCPPGQTPAFSQGEECFCVPNDVRIAALAAEPAASRFVPSNRTGWRGLLSGTERAMYMVGGRRGDVPTGEIWRYAVDEQVWRHVFLLPPPSTTLTPQVRVGDVHALAYAPATGKLLILDTVKPSRAQSLPGSLGSASRGDRAAKRDGDDHELAGSHRKVARLLVFDTHTGTSRIDQTFPVVGVFSKVGMAARDDGSFVLVGLI